MNWFALSIISLFSFGLQQFLYKVSAKNKCNSVWTSTSFMITVFILSSVWFFIERPPIENISVLVILAVLNALFFVGTSITRFESLKHIAANKVYPFVSLSKVIVVLFGIFYFKEHLTFTKGVGVVLSIAVFFLLTQKEKDESDHNQKSE